MQLYQGDCLEVMKQIPDKQVDMILCDLPYGTTACKWDTIIPFDKLWAQYNRIIKDGGAIVLFGSEPFSSALRMSNIKNFKYDWVWNKKQTGNPFLAKKQPLKIHEVISVFNTNIYLPIMRVGKMRVKGGSKKSNIKIFGGTDQTVNNLYYPVSILEFANCSQKETKLHPTQKPVTLCEYLIKTYTNAGETVLDNCMGSGTTGVACKHLNRNFIGIELDPNYFEIAKNRIENEPTQLTLAEQKDVK
jgi:site-specific DNA-methyltransferase (adenine-specific)